MFRGKKFIYIDNPSELGKFYVHHAERDLNESILTPVFKPESIEKNQTDLIPGYIDRELNFYSCPIITNYIKIKKYEFIEIYVKEEYRNVRTATLFLEVYDKTLENYISETITLAEKLQICSIDFLNFNHIINFLNKYVDSGRDINKIDFKLFSKSYPKLVDKQIILQNVKSLDLKVFEDSKNRVGKDNRFWTEMEVRNLPENEYLKDLFIKCLSKQGRKLIADFGVVIELYSDYIWSPTHPRKHLENYSTESIKETLIMDLAIEFNSEEYVLSSMEIKTCYNNV
ncbi:hypothetical protein [Aequorivita echinoideorum]|uniref:Uncharacterized protein n=1 Tax=Aequorivita echinoideorum TaxID=1549647 RepID=A0ABS5S7L6_9FLAO|nr:hypothetical protein [Aequorivita echinoideorum]MBT0609203.1 hypothetical protein [Aequorivita echinoideorum]